MTFQETLAWQRVNSPHINRLAQLGDVLAKRLIAAYVDLHGDRLNPAKQADWMKICDDFCRRDLTITTREILADRFGHKLSHNYRRYN